MGVSIVPGSWGGYPGLRIDRDTDALEEPVVRSPSRQGMDPAIRDFGVFAGGLGAEDDPLGADLGDPMRP